MKAQMETRLYHALEPGPGFPFTWRMPRTMATLLGLCMACSFGCNVGAKESSKKTSQEAPAKAAGKQPAEAKGPEARSVDPKVQSDIEKMEAEKRATLLQDAQAALSETRNALAALDKNDKQAALAALERATGKLDLVVARDRKMAFAPVSVSTTMLDLYATPDTVRRAVKTAKDDLSSNRVQQARLLVQNLASEADINVTELPLATYPAAIRAVVPLIDSGKIEEARAALYTALNTLVVETYIVPLPRVRAEAMLAEANKLASASNRKEEDKTKVRALIEATRNELQLAEALGYGTSDTYKPLYAQLDEIRAKTDSGQSGTGLLDKLRQSLRNFKFST